MQAQLDQEGQEDPEESPDGQEPDPQGFLNPELHLLPPTAIFPFTFFHFPLNLGFNFFKTLNPKGL